MDMREVDLREMDLTADVVLCHTCSELIRLTEIFDAWEIGVGRDECPRCRGMLLAPVVPGPR
jgi:hypothetical protein